jgi:hypothetical protein
MALEKSKIKGMVRRLGLPVFLSGLLISSYAFIFVVGI